MPVSQRRGLMFVLSSPSGAGKTTLSRMLMDKQKESQENDSLCLSVSVTTRPKRPGEEHGKDYFFVSHEEFESMVVNNELLEYARVFDHYYGTPATYVESKISNGIDVLFDIDWQGTHQLASSARSDLVSVFILPPSMKELERRLKARAQDSDEVVAKRMSKALAEISHWREYDYVLVNENLDQTLIRINRILLAERLRRHRQLSLESFVHSL